VDNFKTIEVRWFYPGALPAEFLAWFKPLATADSRTDVYLQSSSPDMGLKLRQGNLEVKYRQAKLGTIEVEKFGTAQVEQWSKWICIDDSASLTPEQIANQPGWIKVAKVRHQRLYQGEFGDEIQLKPISIPQAGAAAIEVTQLQLDDRIWWTIACEYLGDNIDLERQFSPLVKSLLSACPLPLSTPAISCGYPEWLNRNNRDHRISTD
jgi:hypothetical protein